ncbi:four helix bundle protein [uncultured Flavobacterium sp.]|uniref:four helix bundle protein n=1 Tax=uncultured Flavobacterium sp. TaxID=165435 RepID=UPI0030EF53A7
MKEYDLKKRTKSFTISILNLVDNLPLKTSTKIIANQLGRYGSSVGANYRASLRARSDNEYVSKLNIVLEEADESLFWLEVLEELNIIENDKLKPLLKEANELTAIFVTTLKNTKTRINNK